MALVLQRRERHNIDAVRPLISRVGQTAKDDQGRRCPSGVFYNLIPYVDQVLGGFLDLVCSELDLDAAPTAVRQL